MITYNDFEKIDIRIGTILEASPLPNARNPAYLMHIDFGELGILKTSAQITARYKAKALLGKQVLAVVNFPKKQIGKIQSACLVLGSLNKDGVILLKTPVKVKNGTKVQ